MRIADLRLKSAKHDEERPNVDAFRRRVVIQQFLNDLSPVLSVYARKISPSCGFPSGEPALLLERVEELSRDIAENAGEDPKLMAKSYRPAAAHILSEMSLNGGDAESQKAYVEGFLGLLKSYQSVEIAERDPYPDYSDEASVFLTGASVASKLAAVVMAYSFRQEPSKVLKRLTASVLDVAVKVPAMLAEEPVDAKRSLMQTLSNRAADLMAASYTRVAHETVLALQDCTETEVVEFLNREDRVSLVIAEFDKWASLWFASANSYAAGVIEAAKPHTECPRP